MNLKTDGHQDECVHGQYRRGGQFRPKEIGGVRIGFGIRRYPGRKNAHSNGHKIRGEAFIEDRRERGVGIDGDERAKPEREAQHRQHAEKPRLVAAGYPNESRAFSQPSSGDPAAMRFKRNGDG